MLSVLLLRSAGENSALRGANALSFQFPVEAMLAYVPKTLFSAPFG